VWNSRQGTLWFRQIKEDEMGGACTEEKRTKVWLESLKGRDHLEDLGVDRRIILKQILWRQVWRLWIGFI
jgi:hypothetical protein